MISRKFLIAVFVLFCIAILARDPLQFFAQDPNINDQRNETLSSEITNTQSNPIYLKTESIHSSDSPSNRKIIPNTNYKEYESKYGPLAHSLRGTNIPAYFEIDANGHLVITSSIKSVIEYFLSAQGEESLETIIGRIEEYFDKQLDEPAKSEAFDVLVQYISYKEALIDLEESITETNRLSPGGSDYQTLFQYRKEMRMNILSEEVYDAFFSEEDRLDSYTADLLRLQREGKISDEENLSLITRLPPKEHEAHLAEMKRNQIAQAKADGASAEELYALRMEAYGVETAERFVEADRKQNEWDSKFQDYREKRQEIINSIGLSEEDKLDEISKIQLTLFNANELRRLPTLDKMADQKSAL